MANANTISAAGVSGPLAIELARQINAGAGNGNASYLITLGVPPSLATEIAAQINANSRDAVKLSKHQMPAHLATILAAG